jgi:hypothetical protein
MGLLRTDNGNALGAGYVNARYATVDRGALWFWAI